jgi:DNA-binding transcriptional regulator YiaG
LQKRDFHEVGASGQNASAWEAKMNKKTISFREQMKLARPDVLERRKRNRLKGNIAMSLRALRDAHGMSQDDISDATGITKVTIEEMESLVGALPRIEDLERFAVVCGGRIEVLISSGKADRPIDKPESSPLE